MLVDPVSRARSLVGTAFKLHGRDPAYGLDCVGLVAAAFCVDDTPQDYALRGGDPATFGRMLRALGCRRRRASPRRGNVFLLRPGPAQFHLGIWTGQSLIHADAGLRRIVETPGWPRWPLTSVWIAPRRRK